MVAPLADTSAMTDTTTQPLSPHVATERYRAAWLAHVEAYDRAAMLSRSAHVPSALPLWQAALVDRDTAFENFRLAQERLREALLASGCTETEARLTIIRASGVADLGVPTSRRPGTEAL